MERSFWTCIDSYEYFTNSCQQLIAKLTESKRDQGNMVNTIVEKITVLQSSVSTQDAYNAAVRDLTSAWGSFSERSDEAEQDAALRDLLVLGDDLRRITDRACLRLEDISESYTLYRDLVILSRTGIVLANANPTRRQAVLGICVAHEPWFNEAMGTQDGSQYFAQDVRDSRLENQPSLIFATAIRANGRETERPIGALGVCFDFQGECQIVLDEYLPKDSTGVIADGWYCFLSNHRQFVISSSDDVSVPVGTIAQIPRSHRHLQKGQHAMSSGVFYGADAFVCSALSDGYLEYGGLGWSCHIIVPRDLPVTLAEDQLLVAGISRSELHQSLILPEVHHQTSARIAEYKESIQLISLNGIVFASKLGRKGAALAPIFDHITKTGDFATAQMERLLEEMAQTELAQNLAALEMFSKQAIDLVDRNLFERAADVRWWATDHFFHEALMSPESAARSAASERLKVINNSYTMYTDLLLIDDRGRIVANSRPELRNEYRDLSLSPLPWFKETMRSHESSSFFTSDVVHSSLENGQVNSLVYAAGVRQGGARVSESLGVLATLFSWETESVNILKSCLQKDKNGQVIPGSVAFYTNARNCIIATTDSERFPVGAVMTFPPAYERLKPGQSMSGSILRCEQRYLIGSTRTKGYREYSGLGWSAHVVRPFSAV